MAQGRFRFKRTPTGLINSGDFFNQIMDSTIRDLQGIIKSVDDCLAQTETLDDLEEILRALFTRCREFNITQPEEIPVGKVHQVRGFQNGWGTQQRGKNTAG